MANQRGICNMSKLQILSILILLLTKWNQVAGMGPKGNRNPDCEVTLNPNSCQTFQCSSTNIKCFAVPRTPNVMPCSETTVTETVRIVKPTSCTLYTTTVHSTHLEQCSLCPTQSQPGISAILSSSPVQQLGMSTNPLSSVSGHTRQQLCTLTKTSLPSASMPMRSASLSSSGECGPMLGMAIAIPLSLVAILLIGWICTAIVLMRRRYKRAAGKGRPQKENVGMSSTNPAYGCETTQLDTQEHANNSMGPTYEQIECVGGNYDILNPRRAPRPHPPTTPTGSHDPTADQTYDTLDNFTQEHEYHVLETIKPKNENTSKDQDSSVFENERKTGLSMIQQDEDLTRTHPQNYEIPANKTSSRNL